MKPYAPFVNEAGRLRSGWRLGIFVLLLAASMFLLGSVVRVIFVLGEHFHFTFSEFVQNVIFRVVLLSGAVLAGWICNRWLEDLPWRALGLSFHSDWLKDLLVGSSIGALSLTMATLIAFLAGGLRFTVSGREVFLEVARALVTTAVLFIVGGLAEEAMFRGYPLQTTIRAGLVAFGILITSVIPFAAVHLKNPSFTALSFTNTALAGVWFAVAYLRTRSLWFPLGVHWAWNWAQGSIFGLPVSGLTLSNHPLLQSFDKGPAWLTGGSYGIEGGLACTVALVISTLFIWRTRLVSATPEMKRLTSEENPVVAQTSVCVARPAITD